MTLSDPRIPLQIVRMCALAIVLGSSVTAYAQTVQLDALVGRDLWNDPLSTDEQSRLNQIVGKVPKGEFIGDLHSEPEPWHVWKAYRNGVVRYVVLIGVPERAIPGGSSACVVLLDDGLRRINRWCFRTGWRMTFHSASFEFSTELGTDVIILEMTSFVNGYNVAKEYFALSGDRLQLARLEDSEGAAVQNEYLLRTYEIGFIPAAETEDEWIDMLQSADSCDILFALMFLGARHLPELPSRFLNPKEDGDALLFRQLIGSQRIRQLIAGLTNSGDLWIKQAALLAARDPRERPVPFSPPRLWFFPTL